MKDVGKIDLVWIEKGIWIQPETLERMKATLRAPLVHYTPDAAFVFHRSRLFEASIPHYELMITSKKFELELYRTRGARCVHYSPKTSSAARFYPRDLTPEQRRATGADITFIGHCEPAYAEHLEAASRVTRSVAIWGAQWPRYALFHRWARGKVRGSGVFGESYPAALCAARIALGLLSKYVPETLTARSLEIPLCGVFMLAERSEDHAAMFEEGQEAEFFSTNAELVDKARYYLQHDSERERIARAGRERALKSGYTTEASAGEYEKLLHQVLQSSR